jgi:ABC-type dipeptide/oligopeptide/nickel transport system ATPase component
MLAQILAKLGESGSGKSLSELAELARLGLLQMSPDEQQALSDAIVDLRELRRDLLRALGMRPKKGGAE